MIGRIAVYYCLYDSDFIADSIRSILPYVDRIFAVYSTKTWGDTKGVEYKGEWVAWPEHFDETRALLATLAADEPKVEVIDDYWPTPVTQDVHCANDIALPRYEARAALFLWRVARDVIHIAADCVFRQEQIERFLNLWENYAHPGAWAQARQIELWRTPAWRIPDRPRTGVLIHRLDGPRVVWPRGGADPTPIRTLDATVHNFGLCARPEVMLWKHLTMLAITRAGLDSQRNEGWYDEKWLSWNPETNNRDLEPSARCEGAISHALPYDVDQLPASIRRRLCEWPVYR